MKKINVTKTSLPPINEYIKYLRSIWKSGHVTNHGPLVNEFEDKLKKYLGVKYLFFVSNGTIALQIAIKALGLKNEVITTPFSYVATTSSLVWENCKPIFADIDPETLTIDPDEIERKITKKTTGIVATHVYGNPCDVLRIQKIATKNSLKIIYDAAHAFGVKYKGKSIMNFGDISIVSFHATKIFHTIEGGAIMTNDSNLAKKIEYMRNFGHKDKESFFGLGINGKNCEFHAAMGLCLLPKISSTIKEREEISEKSDQLLTGLDIKKQKIRGDVEYNYPSYPIILPSENVLHKIIKSLNAHHIFPRRYFYPSLNKLSYVKKQHVPVTEDISRRILCLPLYNDLKEKDVRKISEIIYQNI